MLAFGDLAILRDHDRSCLVSTSVSCFAKNVHVADEACSALFNHASPDHGGTSPVLTRVSVAGGSIDPVACATRVWPERMMMVLPGPTRAEAACLLALPMPPWQVASMWGSIPLSQRTYSGIVG